MSSSLLDTIKYKHVRVGLVKKEGKTYVKFKKVRRFKTKPNISRLVFGFLILVTLGLGVKFL